MNTEYRVNGPGALARRLRAVAHALVNRVRGRSAQNVRDHVQLAVVIPVGDLLANHSTRLQIDILRKYGRNPGLDAYPHITLKMGFKAKDIAPFETYIEQLASEVAPFDISIKNFDFFDEGILFLDVEPYPELEILRQRILNDLSTRFRIEPSEIEGPRYRFHVTLAYGLEDHAFKELRKHFSTQQFQMKFTARHIDLFCHTGDHWVTCKRTTLQSSQSARHAGKTAAQMESRIGATSSTPNQMHAGSASESR